MDAGNNTLVGGMYMKVMTVQEFIDWTPETEGNITAKVVKARKVGSSVYVQYARKANGSSIERPMLVVYTAPAKTPIRT